MNSNPDFHNFTNIVVFDFSGRTISENFWGHGNIWKYFGVRKIFSFYNPIVLRAFIIFQNFLEPRWMIGILKQKWIVGYTKNGEYVVWSRGRSETLRFSAKNQQILELKPDLYVQKYAYRHQKGFSPASRLTPTQRFFFCENHRKRISQKLFRPSEHLKILLK